MVSSLIGPQYHEEDNTFWTFSRAAADHQHNNFDTPIVPEFSEDFEVFLDICIENPIIP